MKLNTKSKNNFARIQEPYRSRLKAFIKALRSHRYKQNSYFLGQRDVVSGEYSYCVLGVACRVFEKFSKRKISRFFSSSNTTTWKLESFGPITWDGCHDKLPDVVRDWYGFIDDSVRINHKVQIISLKYNRRISLIDLNDTYKYSFDQIADVLEQSGYTAIRRVHLIKKDK